VGCEDGVFPHSRALDEGGLEEERRLFYVGVTRAMRELYLTHAVRRAVFGAQRSGVRSRFLDEIPATLFDQPELRPAWAASPGLESGDGVLRAARGPAAAASNWDSAATGDAPATVSFRLGEDIVHAAFGEGVVTGVEPDGVIVV